jgi:TRAP transporter 4TM/12TM fusion protein
MSKIKAAWSTAPDVVAVVVALVHLTYVFHNIWSYGRHCIFHVMSMMLVILLYKLKEAHFVRHRVMAGILLSLVLITGVYLLVAATRLELGFGMGLSNLDFVVGVILITLVLTMTYMLWGWTLLILGLVAVLYMLFGPYAPGVFKTPGVDLDTAMGFLGMSVCTGVFGFIIPISATMLFYFMLFGDVLHVGGVLPMFIEVGKWIGRKLKGGGAYVALVASSLLGTVSGATIANVALTGQYTIPMMKGQGLKGESAVAVESVASMGGQILPPVMGTGAFIMASLTCIPYIDICTKAVFPAVIYYLLALVAITLLVRRSNIVLMREQVDWGLILRRLPVFIVPVGILVYLLVQRYSPGYVVTIALFVCLAVSFLQKSTRPSLKAVFGAFAHGTRAAAEIAVAISLLAIVGQVVITTSLAPKLAFAIMGISGGSIVFSAILLMVVSIILGMGMPTPAAYTLAAIVVVPALVRLGIGLFEAHFFAFYFAVFAAVTPPVAVAPLVGSKIAGVEFWKCSRQALRLSLPFFMLPFAFLAEPGLLTLNVDLDAAVMLLGCLAGGFMLSSLLFRQYFFSAIDRVDTALFALGVAMMIPYAFGLASSKFLVGGAILALAVVTVKQTVGWRRILKGESNR